MSVVAIIQGKRKVTFFAYQGVKFMGIYCFLFWESKLTIRNLKLPYNLRIRSPELQYIFIFFVDIDNIILSL